MTVAARPDLSAHIGDIARAILGEPNRERSTWKELRFGSHGSVAVEIAGPERGRWYDHERQVGGGGYEFVNIKGEIPADEVDDWLRRHGFPCKNGHDQSAGRFRIVKTYDYQAEDGTLLFQVCRFAPKDFRQRKPDGKGGWDWSTKGVHKVPYRLPDLIAAPADTCIYITEGEKDADNLAALGLVATTNPGGAAKPKGDGTPTKPKWPDGFATYFKSRHIVILPDNDETGHAHAQAVARNLSPVAASVRIVYLAEDWPGMPPKGDVSDWLGFGGTRERLGQLAASAAPIRTVPAMPKGEKSGAAWETGLILSKTKPLAIIANAMIAFREAPAWRGKLAYDTFGLRTTIRGKTPFPELTGEEWTSSHDVRAAEWLQYHGILVRPDVAGQAIEAVAREHQYHPVRDYLDGLEWDGRKRLDAWGIDHLGAVDTNYVRAVCAKWMISAVARVKDPGCKADCIPIFEGPQGLLKSTALKTLADPWFTDEVAELGTKDSEIQLAGVWVIELSELDSIARGEISRVKAFASRATDRYRPPYGKRPVNQPRQCVFAGTVNQDQYLRDDTGGRRWWPVACTKIEIPKLADARDQLWAEATARYQMGEPWHLETKKLTDEAEEEQTARYRHDVWETPIAEYIEHKKSVSVGAILKDALFITTDKWRQQDQNRVASVLRLFKWSRKQVRIAGTIRREWMYYPPIISDDDSGEW